MHLEPLDEIKWAYQLHYYFCWRTHRRRLIFTHQEHLDAIANLLPTLSQQHGYHLIRYKVYSDHVRCLFSLRPEHDISSLAKAIKGALSRGLCSDLSLTSPLWARGFLARSVGSVRIDAVKEYLDRQAEHHGYAHRRSPPVFRYRAKSPRILAAAHSAFELNHHLVFATRYRRGVFGRETGAALMRYWAAVATKRGFAIDRAAILPDHAHLLVRVPPEMSIETAALALMNNGQYWVGKHFPDLLLKAEADQLWQPSAYAGTCGKVSTALVKSFLSSGE